MRKSFCFLCFLLKFRCVRCVDLIYAMLSDEEKDELWEMGNFFSFLFWICLNYDVGLMWFSERDLYMNYSRLWFKDWNVTFWNGNHIVDLIVIWDLLWIQIQGVEEIFVAIVKFNFFLWHFAFDLFCLMRLLLLLVSGSCHCKLIEVLNRVIESFIKWRIFLHLKEKALGLVVI